MLLACAGPTCSALCAAGRGLPRAVRQLPRRLQGFHRAAAARRAMFRDMLKVAKILSPPATESKAKISTRLKELQKLQYAARKVKRDPPRNCCYPPNGCLRTTSPPPPARPAGCLGAP